MGEMIISPAGMDALGYIGGGILALSLIPQIIKLLMTRSAQDISLLWSLMYLTGSTLSLVYLIFVGALAAWIPVVLEVLGCTITITLKLMFDYTSWGSPTCSPEEDPQQLVEAGAKPGLGNLILNEKTAASAAIPPARAAGAVQRATSPRQAVRERLPWYSQPGISHTVAIPEPQVFCCHACGAVQQLPQRLSLGSQGTVAFSSAIRSVYNTLWHNTEAGSKGHSRTGGCASQPASAHGGGDKGRGYLTKMSSFLRLQPLAPIPGSGSHVIESEPESFTTADGEVAAGSSAVTILMAEERAEPATGSAAAAAEVKQKHFSMVNGTLAVSEARATAARTESEAIPGSQLFLPLTPLAATVPTAGPVDAAAAALKAQPAVGVRHSYLRTTARSIEGIACGSPIDGCSSSSRSSEDGAAWHTAAGSESKGVLHATDQLRSMYMEDA
jgi:uncharacterized protein with PQ loop repeat